MLFTRFDGCVNSLIELHIKQCWRTPILGKAEKMQHQTPNCEGLFHLISYLAGEQQPSPLATLPQCFASSDEQHWLVVTAISGQQKKLFSCQVEFCCAGAAQLQLEAAATCLPPTASTINRATARFQFK